MYYFFSGKDGSKAFITGDFTEEGLIDDVLDLSLQDLKSLSDWSKFYHKEYRYKGKICFIYYWSFTIILINEYMIVFIIFFFKVNSLGDIITLMDVQLDIIISFRKN